MSDVNVTSLAELVKHDLDEYNYIMTKLDSIESLLVQLTKDGVARSDSFLNEMLPIGWRLALDSTVAFREIGRALIEMLTKTRDDLVAKSRKFVEKYSDVVSRA